MYVAQWVHRRRNARVSRARDAHARFDGAHHQVRQMLVGTGGAAIPRVVRDIDEEVRPPAAIATRQVGKDRFVTDQHAEPADRGRVERQPAPLTETPEPVQVEPARRDEGHPLDDGHEVMLVVDRVGRPVTRRIVKERSIVVVVHRGGIEAAGEEWRVCLTPALSEPSVPIRAAHEVVGYGGFGPKQQVEPAAVLQPSREGEQIGHDAVLVRLVPLLPEADVRLNEPHDARGAQRQRALAPRPVAPREGDAQEHHGGGLPPNRTSPFSLLPRQQRLDDHHVAPGQPQRYAARARQVRPLHQDRRIGERRAEAQPGKPDVPLVADAPVHGGPYHREQHPQGHRGEPNPALHDEPEQPRRPQSVDRDRGEIPEGREGREVPEGDDQPVEHQPLGHEAVPEAEAERPAQVRRTLELPQQHHCGRDGDEAQDGDVERRIAQREQDRAERDQHARPPGRAGHSNTSRPSSAER